MAYYYLKGYGVEANPQKAAYWYQAAAQSGLPEAQAELGQLLLTGTGIGKDYEQAVYWFTKSALQGNPAGQAKLGYMYLAGLGVEKDWIKAYALFKIAAQNQNDEAIRELKMLKNKLSDADIKAGDELSKEILQKTDVQSENNE